MKQKLQGEIDDSRLVDGVSGDQRIYKMRGKDDPMLGKFSKISEMFRISY